MSNPNKAQLATTVEEQARKIAELEAAATPVVEPAGNMWVDVSYCGEQIGSLRIDNMQFGNKDFAGLLQRDSDKLFAEASTLEAILADYAANLQFNPRRSINAPKTERLSDHLHPKEAVATRGASRFSPKTQPVTAV